MLNLGVMYQQRVDQTMPSNLIRLSDHYFQEGSNVRVTVSCVYININHMLHNAHNEKHNGGRIRFFHVAP